MDQTWAGLIVTDLVDAVRDVIRRHSVTYPEYHRAVELMAVAGGSDGAGFTCRFDFTLAPVR